MYIPPFMKFAVKRAILSMGYTIVPASGKPRPDLDGPDKQQFKACAKAVTGRHRQQSLDDVEALNRKYREPVFGEMRIWDLVERLSLCVDPTDGRLLNTSQYIHVLQILEAMDRDGVQSTEMYVAAMVHDLGKLLLLTSEAPENIVCTNSPIGDYEPGIGLDNIVTQWNHDEFAYSRLKDYVSDEIAWLIRYHSMDLPTCEKYMDDRDLRCRDRYFYAFHRYDFGTKSPHRNPGRHYLTDRRDLLESIFPHPIPF
ncbi:MAG: inositol oxygenase family protein [Arenicellales bacterium]